MLLGITDHLEGPRDRASGEIFAEVSELVRIADNAGARYFWFTEHHAHVHHGHLPTPLLFALHLASQVKSIHLGTAVICLNLHHPLDVAEQVAVADVLTGGRLAAGFGSGSAPREPEFFGQSELCENARHERFEEALRIIRGAWAGNLQADDLKHFSIRPHHPLPLPTNDLPGRCWIAANSSVAAQIAGSHGFNMLFSHLRTPEQHREYIEAYRSAGGTGSIAENRPVFVGRTDAEAFAAVEPALRILWRRFQYEGKIPADVAEPSTIDALCAHPINFIIGGPETVVSKIRSLRREVPFDVLNAEVRWTGLDHRIVCDSLKRLAVDVMGRLHETRGE